MIYSSSDRDSTAHARLAELVVERARRMVEQGRHVFVLFDSLTTWPRAYNKNQTGGGLHHVRRASTRALSKRPNVCSAPPAFSTKADRSPSWGPHFIETNSAASDDVIFQEFKGTGNMELVLDRKLADRRIFPAIDIPQSGTRKEERLFSKEEYPQVTLLRRSLMQLSPQEAMESLVKQLANYPDNATFLARVNTFVR